MCLLFTTLQNVRRAGLNNQVGRAPWTTKNVHAGIYLYGANFIANLNGLMGRTSYNT